MRTQDNTQLFARILDYFCAPYYDAVTTRNYNSWALQNGRPTIDSIFQVRYFTGGRSQGGLANLTDPMGAVVAETNRLDWNLGWNQYYSSTDPVNSLADVGAILAPTDEAIKNYFLPGGGGAYFIDLYGTHENTEENLPLNLDDLHNRGNGILTSFVNNLIQTSFTASVPSKFGTITNEGSGDFMGLTKGDIAVTEDNRYDVAVANNGVIYKMKNMIAPDEYQSVIGPAITYPDMSVMGYFSKDKTSGATSSIFGADMYYYLMAMKANYLYFIPSDSAMKRCYIDPISLGSANPRALEFYSHVEPVPGTERTQTLYGVKIHNYDPETGVIDPAIRQTVANIVNNGKSDYASQVYDLLNYNTVVLDAGEQIVNNYYLTKHGGAIRIDGFSDANGTFSGKVYGGAQIDNGVEPANIETGWKEKNGWAFRLDGIIQPSLTSVNKLLNTHADQFQKFLDLCTFLTYETDVLEWAGIAGTASVGTAPQQRYYVFSDKEGKALDMNVNFFNGFNYTLYAPDNTAMDKAYAMGLPTNEQIRALYDEFSLLEAEGDMEDPTIKGQVDEAKAVVLNMLNALRAFVRYHFQNNSVFADNYVPNVTYQSLYSSELGIPVNLNIESTNGVLTVKDESGKAHIINAADENVKLVNKMTRDYEFDKAKENAAAIAVSSFAVVHQISEPLCYEKSGRYDKNWATRAAVEQAIQNYSQLVNLVNNFKD